MIVMRAEIEERNPVMEMLVVGEPDIVGPTVSVGFDVMAAAVIAAIDQHIANAGCAHFAEGDFCRTALKYLMVFGVTHGGRIPPVDVDQRRRCGTRCIGGSFPAAHRDRL
jgi:hypothetical protein